MNLRPEDVRNIHVITEALILTLEQQLARRAITEGNVAIDAVINCLCYAMKRCEPRLEDEEILRRVKIYYEAMDLPGAPGIPGKSRK